VTADDDATIPEPAAAAGTKVQDNVTEPGTQRTVHPDGTTQDHVTGGDNVGDDVVTDEPTDAAPADTTTDDEPADGVGDQDGDAADTGDAADQD
jgi:hypothetical protein